MAYKDGFVYLSAIILGTAVGGTLGALVFSSLIPNMTKGTITGVVLGAILGIAIASGLMMLEKRWHDQELRADAEDALESAEVPRSVHLSVKEGRVILDGEVHDPDVQSRAEEALATVPGVVAVENRITLPQAITSSPADIARRIRANLIHLAAEDAGAIRVLMREGSRVVLEGKVRSWPSASQAEEIAWRTPGVQTVDNQLDVEDIAA